MEQGDAKKPFQEPDNGVTRSEGSPFQEVKRTEPPYGPSEPRSLSDGDTTTEPIPLILHDAPTGSEIEEDAQDEVEEYFFRRHLRDILERLFVRDIGPRWYTPFVYSGLVLLVVPIVVMIVAARVDLTFAWLSIACSLLVSWYPLGREIYRHYTRTVRLFRSPRGILIIYKQPTSLFWGFTGDGNDDESFLEGSTEIRKRIGFLNRFPFFGCGDITIYGKVEGGRIDFRNVPHVNRLQRFLSTRA
jgi:hypothetical protein